MAETMYQFKDKSGHCFEDFQSLGDGRGNDMAGAMLRASNDGKHDFTVGDMIAFKDDLEIAGFCWGKDYYVIKKGG